jgi:hypothetical protein
VIASWFKIDEELKLKTIVAPTGNMTLVKGDTGFATVAGIVLSPEDYQNLVYGRRTIYVVAEYSYNDDSGKHTRQFCRGLLPPQPGGLLIWADCEQFNGEY